MRAAREGGARPATASDDRGRRGPLAALRERARFIRGRVRSGRLHEMRRQLAWVMGYARHYWRQMLFYTALGMSSTLVALLSSLVSKDLVDIITGHQPGELARTFALMIATALGGILLGQLTSYVSGKISMTVDAQIKQDVFAKILVTDWQSLSRYHTGDLLTRWSADVSNVSSAALTFLPNLVVSVFRFASALFVVVSYDWTFAVFALIGIPVSALLSRRLIARMQDNNMRSSQMSARISGFDQETFSNIQTIKAFDLVRLYGERLRQLQRDYIGMRLEFSRMNMATSIVMGVVGLAVSYGCYGWGIYRVWSGAISYGTMTMFLTLTGTLTGAANSLGSMVPGVISLTTSAGRLMDILEMPREDYAAAPRVQDFARDHAAEGVTLLVRDVAYAYADGTRVFEGARMEARPHEVVGLVGPSGSGKTTMLRLLLALVRPDAGSIELSAGGDAMEMTPPARALMSYVPQGNTMLSGTIAENLRVVRPDATDEEIRAALEAADAWEFVSALPDGINHEIRERGGGFSEGQAQRLSIARALLRRAPILLLDEATSALDVATERAVLRNVMRDEYPRTCVVTTHRPTVLGMCTRVYAIEDGRLRLLDDADVERRMREF